MVAVAGFRGTCSLLRVSSISLCVESRISSIAAKLSRAFIDALIVDALLENRDEKFDRCRHTAKLMALVAVAQRAAFRDGDIEVASRI